MKLSVSAHEFCSVCGPSSVPSPTGGEGARLRGSWLLDGAVPPHGPALFYLFQSACCSCSVCSLYLYTAHGLCMSQIMNCAHLRLRAAEIGLGCLAARAQMGLNASAPGGLMLFMSTALCPGLQLSSQPWVLSCLSRGFLCLGRSRSSRTLPGARVTVSLWGARGQQKGSPARVCPR